MKSKPNEMNRRDFLKTGAIAAGAIAAIGATTFVLDHKAAEAMPREDFCARPAQLTKKTFCMVVSNVALCANLSC